MSHKAEVYSTGCLRRGSGKNYDDSARYPGCAFTDSSFYKDQFRVEGRRVILTFGLLAPDKGVEYMIEALPAIVRHHPDIIYIILGATHPHIQREHGEAYRLGLQLRARALGVEQHVMFHNRFVELKSCASFWR